MTSLKYNTFSEDIANQCIICLQESTVAINDEVTLMNNMHFLQKPCNCVCYAHHKCIENWIKSNAICPICRKNISFPQIKKTTNVKNETVIYIEPLINGANAMGANAMGANAMGANAMDTNAIDTNAIDTTSIDTNEIVDSNKHCRETLRIYMFFLLLLCICIGLSNMYII